MPKQSAKRASKQWVAQILEQFNNHTITEKDVCELLGIGRSQLYEHRKRWLKITLKNQLFKLETVEKDSYCCHSEAEP